SCMYSAKARTNCTWTSVVPRGTTGRSQCSTNGFFPHESQCDGYYECRNGTVHQGLCPDGLVFNDDAGHKYLRCDLPFSVNCENRPYLRKCLGPLARKRSVTFLNVIHSMRQITDHTPRRQQVNMCCARLYSEDMRDPISQLCIASESFPRRPYIHRPSCCAAYLGFQCPEATSYDLQDFANPPYPHPRDCAKHFVCVASYYGKRLPRLLSCDYGLVFNPTTRLCDDPLNVHGWCVD
ncbi:hypothetical protein IscW_ISCW024120, partial [Ixodes scapularis]